MEQRGTVEGKAAARPSVTLFLQPQHNPSLPEEGLTSRGGRHLRLPLRFGLRPQGPCRVGCLENPMNSMKRQNDRILKEELPRSVGAQFATGNHEVKVPQSCPTLCDPMDYTVHGILQARMLEWVAFLFSRGSSQPRD